MYPRIRKKERNESIARQNRIDNNIISSGTLLSSKFWLEQKRGAVVSDMVEDRLLEMRFVAFPGLFPLRMSPSKALERKQSPVTPAHVSAESLVSIHPTFWTLEVSTECSSRAQSRTQENWLQWPRAVAPGTPSVSLTSTDHVRTASLRVSGGISDWESRAPSLPYTSKMKENDKPLKMASSECLWPVTWPGATGNQSPGLKGGRPCANWMGPRPSLGSSMEEGKNVSI